MRCVPIRPTLPAPRRRVSVVGPVRAFLLACAAAPALALAQASEPTASAASTPADPAPLLSPLPGPDGRLATPPWQPALLPAQTLPQTRFAAVALPGGAEPGGWALRIDADASYGNLLHPFDTPAQRQRAAAGTLSWWWRVERPNPTIDLSTRAGDDTELKVCVLFDLPLARVPLGERLLLQLARSRTGEALPAATVCYTADARLASGTRVDNAHSRRVRYLVLRGRGDAPGQWQAESRRVADDFRQLFGDESREVPPVLAVAVGADADNTRGTSRALLARLRLDPSTPPDRP